LLLIGFGGLLLLLAFTGLNALSVVHKIEVRNDQIRRDYFNRDRILEQLKSDIYQSGTYVRDFLLDPDPAHADIHRQEFDAARSRIEAMLAEYESMLRPEERGPFSRFTAELKEYFDSLQPALNWDAADRRKLGYRFMRDSLLPRRMVMVHLADQISRVNERQMRVGAAQVAELFSSFRQSLITLLILTLVIGLGLAGLSIARILRLERLSEVRFDEVLRARTDLRDLSTRLLEVQEEERRSISRELHDEIGQSLSALVLGLGNLAAVISPEDKRTLDELQDLRHLVEKTVAMVRDMSLLLRPSMLDDLGLVPALQWQAREVLRRQNLSVHVIADSAFEDLSDEYKTCIYRVVQEALHNVTRHAAAGTVQIHLSEREKTLVLTIKDDGRGFQPEMEKGLGLLGMGERVRRLSGQLYIESSPGKGALLRIELPLPPVYAGV
jgi:signal transduction histidine kinase